MGQRDKLILGFAGITLAGVLVFLGRSGAQDANNKQTPPRLPDAVQDAQAPRAVPGERPEQQQTKHDQSDLFDPRRPAPLSPAFKDQPKEGRITGFDFARDPLNADEPFQTLTAIMKKEKEGRPKVAQAQRKLLENR
jgi:hypothetical protein